MATGWVFTDGQYQYLSESGIRLDGLRNINGHWYMLFNGNMKTGLFTYQNIQLLLGTDGSLINGIIFEFSKGYYFANSNMEYQTGWQFFNGNWYYFGPDKLMQHGWLSYNGNWYYLDENGVMVSNRSITIGGTVYYFDASGIYQPA